MKKKVSYKKAGVDIDKANKLITRVKKLINTTRTQGSVDSIGGFAGFFDPAKEGVKNPLLVASTDGVGTKLKIAQIAGKHDTVGIDLVAMCVNDVLCSGARPLFFLDYFATGKLNPKVWEEAIKGIVEGCRQADCALLGGETAEMPGMYAKDEYDLAGFAVGAADRKKVIDGRTVKKGDVILGIASSGLHSNGFSLVRKIFSKRYLKRNYKLFLEPTHIYVKPFLKLAKELKIKAASNITGGGFYDNVPRMLPDNARAVICKNTWEMPDIFRIIKKAAHIKERELYRTFNMGIGMALVLTEKDAKKAMKMLKKDFRLGSWIIGEIDSGKKGIKIF